jgi:hypothetical protein
MIIDPLWPFGPYTEVSPLDRAQSAPEPEGKTTCYLHGPNVWQDLAALRAHRPDIKIVILHVDDFERWGHSQQERHERMQNTLRRRLGIWDSRETQLLKDEDTKRWTWKMPPANPDLDLADLLDSVRIMFAGTD